MPNEPFIPDQFNAAEYFIDRHIVEGREGNIAIEYAGGTVTYGELYKKVNQFGNGLKKIGIQKSDRVVLLLLDSPEFAVSFFGAIKVGAVPIPVNTLLMPSDYEYILNDSRARVIVVNNTLLSKIESIQKEHLHYLEHIFVTGTESVNVQSFGVFLADQSDFLTPAPTGKDDMAFWLYSSGSTGAPKACVHLQHDMVICSEYYARGIMHMTEHDRCFSVSKLFFAYGLGNALYYPFAVGGTTILLAGSPKPEIVFDIIQKYRPTLFFSVPSNYAALLDYADQKAGAALDISSIHYGVSAGETLPVALFNRFKARFNIDILDGIGCTEALQAFISNRPGDIRPGSSGKIIPGYEVKILDDDGAPAKTGEPGNLFVKSAATCAYYWNQPEKTKESIQGEWLRTGDKYYEDGDGYFWYVGRADDMMKCSGVWVSPIEIEAVLVQHPAVFEAAVVGELDKNELMKPVAYITLRSGYKEGQELRKELEQFVTERLPVYKRPRRIEFMTELPRTATGKIQRFKLRQDQVGQ
jgi:benzoate-CoA ligase